MCKNTEPMPLKEKRRNVNGKKVVCFSLHIAARAHFYIELCVVCLFVCAGIEGFKRDFCSRLWMTYRREFPIMNGSNYTSDCGWGCMIRSGQMLLAEAMVRHFLSRSWRWDADSQIHITHDDNMHRKIIRWFGDSSSKNSPFSIHTLVNLGEETGKKAGDWYGPSSVSHLLRFVFGLCFDLLQFCMCEWNVKR